MANSYSMHHSWRCSAVLAEYVLGICWAADPWHLFFGFQEVKFRTVSCWSGAPGKCKRTWLAREHNCCFAGTWGTPCHASAIWEQRRMRVAYLRSYWAICFQILPLKSWLIDIAGETTKTTKRKFRNVGRLFSAFMSYFLRKISTVCWGHDRDALGWGPMGPFSFPCK